MAELILGAVSLGLAVPGTLIALAQCGDYIVKKIDTFRHSSSVLDELRTFGYELHQSQLNVDIQIAQQAFASDADDDTLRKSLNDHIKALALQLVGACKYVDEVCVDNVVDKFFFTTVRARRGKQINKGLKEWQAGFLRTVQLLQAQRQSVPNSLLLNGTRLTDIEDPVELEVRSEDANRSTLLLTGKCEHKAISPDGDGAGIKTTIVLFERLKGPAVSEDQAKTIAGYLARRFKQQEHRGILPCLGYRMKPHTELCFQLPTDDFQVQSLASLIERDTAQSRMIHRKLEDKFLLAKALSEAVFSVSTTNFVHKSIRSSTIMLLQQRLAQGAPPDTSIGKLFLSNWQFLRRDDALSQYSNPADDWQDDVYRHPKRYGLRAQERYNTGHDIYSLGVCLLEIGLWATLTVIDANTNETIPADLFMRAGAAHFNTAQAELDLISKFRQPDDIQLILISIADTELPGRMGSTYAQLVKQCLSCLERGFGQDIDFRKMSSVEAGVFLNDVVLGSFPALTSG